MSVRISAATVKSAGSLIARALRDWFSAAEVIAPSGDTTGATDAAAINAATAAGKSVQLAPGVYYVNAPLNLGNEATQTGYTIRGAPWQVGYGSFNILGGTEIRAVGAIPIMKYVPTTYAAQPTNPQAGAQRIGGVHVENIAFKGGTYAIQVGSTFNSGVVYGTFRNLVAREWTQWAFWFENCAYCTFDKLYASKGNSAAVGQMTFTASQSALIAGNSTFTRIFAETFDPRQRGIVFGAYAGTVAAIAQHNDLNAFDVQCNQGGASRTATATSAGAADLVLSAYGTSASIASFPVDMPITVATTSLGLVKWQSYFVIANNGVDTIQISDQMGGAAKTVSAGAVGINAIGFPSIEIVGYGNTSQYSKITQSTFNGIDAEGKASTSILVQNARVDLGLTYTDSGHSAADRFSTLTVRRSSGTSRAAGAISADFDSYSLGLVQLFGANFPTDAEEITQRPAGIFYDSSLGQAVFNLSGGSGAKRTLISQATGTGQMLYPFIPFGQRVSYSNGTPRAMLASTDAGTVAYTGAGAGTWTLPQLRTGAPGQGATANTSAGEGYEIANCGGGDLTLNTWSATNGANPNNGNVGATDDTFQRSAVKNSYSCPVGSSIVVRANYDGTKAFWQVVANNGCT